MKKKILINIHYLEIGGAETSLIGLLYSLDPSLYEVDLLINDPRGELMQYIPKWIKLIPGPKSYNFIERSLKDTLKAGHITLAIARIWAKYKYCKYVQKKNPKTGDAIFGYIGRYVTPILPSLKYLGEYDVAISYITPHNIVAKKISAKKKIAWIHTDYSKVDVNVEIELPIWSEYDKIVSISPTVTRSFLSVFPTLEDKIIEIENFLPENLILQRTKEFVPEDMPKENGTLNILTIGRYCEAKRLDEIPVIAKILKDSKILFKWYIIGYGNQDELQKIEEAIKKNNVLDRIILLGKKENPYPYIKECDIYVQPSRYEGKSITVREAQLLGKLVVITNYPTATSQINDGVDGFIGPYETRSFAHFLKKLIKDSKISFIPTNY
ncbi:MAG: glycosyltransferase [Muribaculaceae bacterium]|nr:glycosyltransferase [Muribaculaceae bacterium]